ncbi:hypothetical protein BS50DRAFT_580615 [Corynespora cassiicola Philippines]|uniref:Methyltransferase FkbM domain-containing protein n=1 Tax=Corynespora cassiicola Philippines TaxID=1448308 RepID=A0A2T2MZE4_CORCC|nr:hypothetical protein BS50DRAFT_580615 [Corynespora cassiicola Philippines]
MRFFYLRLFSKLASIYVLLKLVTTAYLQLQSLLPLSTRPNASCASQQLNMRLAYAERLWENSANARKHMLATSGAHRSFPEGYIYPYNIWDFARPSFFCPHDLERIGSLSDGGKVVCGMSRYETESPGPSSNVNSARPLIVYSFGIGNDSSFETSLLQRTNALVWGYDHSVDTWAEEIPPHQASRAQFKKASIGRVTNLAKDPPQFTIQDLMKSNNHSYIDLVKMDIEGAEFDAMSSLVSFVLGEQREGANATIPIGQLLVEIHLWTAPFDEDDGELIVPKNISSWIQWWSNIEELGLRPVNNEDNWIGNSITGRPSFMEYTLINAHDKKRNILLWE